MFNIYFREITPSSLSDTRIGYQLKDNDLKVFTASFRYNFIDIEFVPYLDSELATGDDIEFYYDRLNANDPDNQPGISPDEGVQKYYDEINNDS